MNLNNMRTICIPDANADFFPLRYLTLMSDNHTRCMVATFLLELKSRTAIELDPTVRGCCHLHR